MDATYKLDGDRLRIEKICSLMLRVAVEGQRLIGHQRQPTFEDNPKRAFTDFLADTVTSAYEICC